MTTLALARSPIGRAISFAASTCSRWKRCRTRCPSSAYPPGRATALAYIGLHPGCDQTELGNVLGINRASTMAAVNNLVSIGVVERRPGRDRRSNALHLTEAGHRLRAEVVQLTADHEEWFFASLTSEERAEFRRLLLKIRQAHGSAEPRLPASKRALLRRVK